MRPLLLPDLAEDITVPLIPTQVRYLLYVHERIIQPIGWWWVDDFHVHILMLYVSQSVYLSLKLMR